MISPALKIREKLLQNGFEYTVVNARCISPIKEQDWQSVLSKLNAHNIVTLEDGSIKGGFGNNFSAQADKWAVNSHILCFGIPDLFVTHGSIDKLRNDIGLDEQSIFNEILNTFHSKKQETV